MVELLVVMAITSLIIGAAGMLFVYTISQCGRATAAAGAIKQANQALDEMENTIRQATGCTIVTSGSFNGLRCTYPNNGVDTDGDGYLDHVYPTKFNSDGSAAYTSGKRVWFYFANSTGAFGTNGNIFWRTQKTNDTNPTSSDADETWAYYYGSKIRFPLIQTMSLSVDTANQTATVTIVASASTYRPEVYVSGTAAGSLETISLSRTVPFRTVSEKSPDSLLGSLL